MGNTSSVTVAGLRVGVPGDKTLPIRGTAATTPKPAPHRGRWATCPACSATGDGSCATCEGSGVVLVSRTPSPETTAPTTRKAGSVTKKRRPEKQPRRRLRT